MKGLSCLALLVMICMTSSVFAGQKLPVVAGTTLRCDQQNNDTPTHGGNLKYAWDFSLAGTSGNTDLGLPVVATDDGVIVYARDANPSAIDAWGKCVIVKFSDGQYGLLAHLDEIFVQENEFVERGQVIGTLGNADGYYPNGAHIHYQRQVGGTPNTVSVASSFEDAGVPTSGSSYTSQSTDLFDNEFTENGGSTKFGSGNPNDSIHWYHVYSPNDLYRSGNVPNNCYVQNWGGGQYGNCGIVYDALGGARRAYTVRTGFWSDGNNHGWSEQGGPTSGLGMPVTNEYPNGSGEARQDFQLGYLHYKQGQSPYEVTINYYPVCAPGWTANGWDPVVSYRLAQIYEENGARNTFGEATGVAYKQGNVWYQYFENGYIDLQPDSPVGGQGGPEIGPVDLVSVFGADSCDLSVQTWFQNDPGPSYSFSGMDGWKHFEPPACYNTWLVRRAVVMDIDSDGDGDLLNCFDYGNNETRFHAFLQDSENLEFDYQGDAGVWHVGGQWGGSYNAQSVKHLVQADLNNDTHPDLIGLYDYGSCQTRFHAWLRHSSTSNYLYQGDGGYWHVGGPYGGSYCASSVKFLVPVNLNGDTYTDLIAAYDYGNNETRFHRFTFNYANHYYTYGGDAGVWHAGGQWGGSYDLNSVKFLVPVKLNDDQYTDLIAAYDYGSGQTRFHAFLWNSSTGKYVHQGDGGYWHMGGPYGGSYPLANLLFLEPVDANGDQYTDLIGAYKYGTNEVRFHSWVYDAANHEYDYYSDNGVWSSTSYLAAGMKFLRSAEAPWRNVVMGRQDEEGSDEQFADHVPHIGDPAALPFARAEVSVVNSPSSGPVRLVYSLSAASEGVLSIHNVVGRKILSCTVPPSSEPQEFLWDCRDDTGNKVPAGVYFVGLTSSNLFSTRKIVLVR